MRLFRIILKSLLLAGVVLYNQAAEDDLHPSAGSAAEPAHAGPPVTPDAPTLFNLGPVPITNAMVYTWVIMALIFVVIRLGTKNLSEIPSGLQNAIESAVEGLEDMTKGLLEPKVAKWCFPVV